jgi:hypothetical protein
MLSASLAEITPSSAFAKSYADPEDTDREPAEGVLR